MIMNDTELKLKVLLLKVFNLKEVPEDYLSFRLGDFTEWDSMGNFNLLLAVEEEFGIRFTIEQMGEIRSIQAILENLSA
jgi:acyl carrier protein